MASYIRSLFSSSGNRNKSQSRPQNRSTSASAIPAQTLSHVYAEPGTVPPIAIPACNARERTNSNVAAQAITPSPLRYTTRDPGPLRGVNRPNSSQQQQYGSSLRHHRGSSDSHTPYSQSSPYQYPTRPSVHRSVSHKGPERRALSLPLSLLSLSNTVCSALVSSVHTQRFVQQRSLYQLVCQQGAVSIKPTAGPPSQIQQFNERRWLRTQICSEAGLDLERKQ